MNKKQVGFQSALLVSWGVIIGAFIFSLLAWWIDLPEVAILLIAISLIGLISRLWGNASLRNIELNVSAESETISVGQNIKFHYKIKNNKAIPLIWLELCQTVPPRRCLIPDESFVYREFSEEESTVCGWFNAYMRRFAFVTPMAEISWDTTWKGACRGVYRPGNFVLRSGDGFGLTQTSGEYEIIKDRIFVVWPEIIPVRTAPFLRHVWTGTNGKSGYTEDPTVMKGIRSYQPGDSWKKIDWRNAARTDELMVRQFDTIMPLSILFVLDIKSIEKKEEAISILASIILMLDRQGVSCGLALPATGKHRAITLRADDTSVSAGSCLFALAEIEAESAGSVFDEPALLSAAASSGQVWMMTESAADISCMQTAQRLNQHNLHLISYVKKQGISVGTEWNVKELKEAAE